MLGDLDGQRYFFCLRRRKAEGNDARRVPAVTKAKLAMAPGPGLEQRGQQSRTSVTLETAIPAQMKAGIRLRARIPQVWLDSGSRKKEEERKEERTKAEEGEETGWKY